MTDAINSLITTPVTAQGDGQNAPVFNEVSIIARQLILGTFDRLLPADDTLLTRGGGTANGLKLYDELERDPKVWETLQKRKLAVTSRNWKAAPPEGDTSRLAKKAADMVAAQLRALSFDQLTTNMLDATLKGISVHEIMWRRDGSEIVADEALDIEPWTLQFKLKPDVDEYRFARCGVRLLTPRNSSDGEKVPHRKFLIHRFGVLGLARGCFGRSFLSVRASSSGSRSRSASECQCRLVSTRTMQRRAKSQRYAQRCAPSSKKRRSWSRKAWRSNSSKPQNRASIHMSASANTWMISLLAWCSASRAARARAVSWPQT
jgi:hypothetical protein